jgi:Caspase domain
MSEKKGIGASPQSVEILTKKGKNYLFAVGINDYVHCPKLKNAVKDVQDFIQLLTTKYQFETDNITTLLDAEANSRNIQRAFRQLAEKVKENDNLIIYFSGHGEFDRIFQQGYWIPVDAERGAFDTYLPNSTIRDVLNAIPSHHTFLIADSCFSGTLFSERDANRDISERLERDASRWGLTAGRNEIVDDGKPGTNSPFATKLLDLLNKNDKELGVAELCAKMMEIVSANADQTPRGEPLKVRGHEGGQFYFHLKNDEKADWAAVLSKNTVADFQKFIQTYPLSINRKEAENRILQLEKEADEKAHSALWEQTKRINTADAYLQFWQNNTDSLYRIEARERMEAAEDREIWAKTPRTRTGMLAYLDKFPMGQHSEEANAFLYPKVEIKPVKPVDPKPEPKPIVKREPKIKTEEKPKIETKPVEKDTENWKINKINVAVGAIIVGLFIGFWLLNAYVIQPLWNKSKITLIENTKGIALPPSVNVQKNEPLDPFEDNMMPVKGGVYSLNVMGGSKKPLNIMVKDFLISKNEVTQKDWKIIMGNDIPIQPKFCDNCPIVADSTKTNVFITKLKERTGKPYRKPSLLELSFFKKQNNDIDVSVKDAFRVARNE